MMIIGLSFGAALTGRITERTTPRAIEKTKTVNEIIASDIRFLKIKIITFVIFIITKYENLYFCRTDIL